MKKKQREKAYSTYIALEHEDLDTETKTVNPSKEGIIAAKEWVDENQK